MPRVPWPPRPPRPARAGAKRWRRGSARRRSCVSSFDDTLPPGGPTIQRAFEALVETFNHRGIGYAIIGALATMQHSRVRTTDDIDALLTVTQIAMPGLFEALAER